MLKKNIHHFVILIIPVLYLLWSLQLNLWGGPFSLSRCDPEYPYLLNGLNCATLSFDNIGHTDHPGTPFQILTGIFLRITHFMIGQGPIAEDVISRPETYLSFASLWITALTFLLVFLLGRTALRRQVPITGVLVLQSTLLLSSVLIDLPLRYNPDRMLVLYNLLLAILIVRYFFTENYPVRRFALLAGVLMGIGFATKFNYLPVLILPLMLIPDFRNKAYYALATAGAFFVSILPILNKFKDFRRFIGDVASHDGLYGQGAQQVINWKSFVPNFVELLSSNPAYTVILLLSIGMIFFFVFNRSKAGDPGRSVVVLKAFLYASALGFLLVSKHFKVYYFVPVLSLAGLALFMIWKLSSERIPSAKIHSWVSGGLLILLIGLSALSLPRQYRFRIAQKEANLQTSRFYAENVSRDDIIFLEPTWMGGPMVENALVYGISYVAHRHEFHSLYNRLYSNIITWEGPGKAPRMFRTADADPESIVLSGRDIFIYSSPGRNAGALISYVDTLAGRYGTWFMKDTAFRNPDNNDLVIRLVNGERWRSVSSSSHLQEKITLATNAPVSSSFWINDAQAGDYLEITLKIFRNDPEAACRLIARSTRFEEDGLYFEDSGSLQDIGDGWQLLRLRGRVGSAPLEGKLVCQAYYPGTKSVTIQDLQIHHLGKR